jgi:hypothetical protein
MYTCLSQEGSSKKLYYELLPSFPACRIVYNLVPCITHSRCMVEMEVQFHAFLNFNLLKRS